ncbi:MAG: DivIVA domain-containing protein [Actinomycetota bacterium]
MAVSPQDIQDKEFREAFRGYNEDDVDTFLDEIAVEYGRLYQENQRMKVQLAALQQEIARGGQGAVASSAAPPSAQAREDEARIEAARKASEAAMEEAKRRAAELVQRAEQRAREIDDLTARRAKDVDADASNALTDAQQRVAELRRQEAEIRKRIRAFLEQQLTSLEPVDLEVAQAAPLGPVAERMARELADDAAPAQQGAGAGEGFWKAE